MAHFLLDPLPWAKQQFAECELGDLRRNKRLIRMAEKLAARPDGSTPDQAESWGECKAMYRLMNCDDVSRAVIIAPHCRLTKQSAAGSTQLILGDTTEIDYGAKRKVAGLGPVGKGQGQGFFLHTGLMRDAETGVISGIAGQELFYRKPRRGRKVAKNSKRRDPERESAVWGRLIDQIGPPPDNVRWIHVCDRGADDYEVYCRALLNNCGWVIRASKMNRLVQDEQGCEFELQDFIARQPLQDKFTLDVPRQGTRRARTAEVTLRFSPLQMPRPRVINAWIRQHGPKAPLPMWVVSVQEENPPSGVEAVKWVLLTSERVTSAIEARQVIEAYRLRWGVEEYHKVLKTGCHVEKRYYETAPRLEWITAVLAILAVRLLQMRFVAQTDPDRPAADVVPVAWVNALAAHVKKSRGSKSSAGIHHH